ncbi:DgyrCDS3979 [Dimorphilus gyrociliatus]|uniref:Protein SDA1 n=1 Tax=Dimorphilus gyrociliatus TaxID=2664684 RepID=A0A7I8VF01_9ANNE|nr:DgyrCDS3979 [Dimorphilus gyrociliatus]
MIRNNNRLPDNLPQLQNLIKRDPESYKDDFLQQYRQYQSNLKIFQLNPSEFSDSFGSLVMFLAQVSHCYTEELKDFPQELINLLHSQRANMNSLVRVTVCQALMLLKNKNLIEAIPVLELFFILLKCQDKNLRKILYNYIVQDVKNTNQKAKNQKLNTKLQNFMYSMLKDNNATAAKLSLDVMVDLYRRNVWKDAKTVNVISTACFSKVTKVLVAAIKFFTGLNEDDEDKDKDSDSDDNDNERVKKKSSTQVLLSHRVGKKTRKRQKKMEKALSVIKKNKKKTKADYFNFSAIHLLNDPQDFAEKLFKQLENCTERFEVKLMMIDLISRLVGIHQLMLLNFYPYIQRYLQPHQRDVTNLLTYAAQSSHDLVPPDTIDPLIRTIANNFITERNSGEAMAVGLNSVREICSRCPLAISEDLVRDLVLYKKHKNKSVMMSARSLIGLFREKNPELLHKRDRGRPTEAMQEIEKLEYGKSYARDYIPGAEILTAEEAARKKKSKGKNKKKEQAETNSDDSDNEDESDQEESWIISDSENENDDDDNNTDNDSDDDKDEDLNEASWESCSEQDESEEDSDGSWINVHHSSDEGELEIPDEVKNMDSKEKIEKAKEVFESRILSQEDFKKVKKRQIQKETENFKKGGRKRGQSVIIDSDEEKQEYVRIMLTHSFYL